MENLSLIRAFSVVFSFSLCIAFTAPKVVAQIADEREAKYETLRQKIEKKIGQEKLKTLDKFGKEFFIKRTEWDPETGAAQSYFRGGRAGTEEEKKFLTEAYMNLKRGQSYILQASFHKDPEWSKFTQTLFDLVITHGGTKQLIGWLERYDKIIEYREVTGPTNTADEFYGEYAKRIPQIEQYSNKIFSEYNIPKRYMLGIRHDATIEVWQNFGDTYFFEIQAEYMKYLGLARLTGKFN